MSTSNFEVICEVFQAIKEEDEVFEFVMILKRYNVVVSYYKNNKWSFVSKVVEMQIVGENNLYKVKLLDEELPIVVDSITFDAKFGNKLVKFNVLNSHMNIKEVAFFEYILVGMPRDISP